MKLFFPFLITYTYRFSHLLAKLCREHFKYVKIFQRYLPQARTTRSFYKDGKYFAVIATPGSSDGFTVDIQHTSELQQRTAYSHGQFVVCYHR